MKVYVSENEIPSNCANCKQFNNYTCGLDKEDKYMKFLTQAPIQKNKYCPLESLEQHEADIRKQELQKVIAELLEWINENKNDYMCRANTQHISGKSFSPHMAGASITVYTDGFVDELKEKLNEMKGEKL